MPIDTLPLVQSAALDYAMRGIHINALIPGTTDTPFLRKAAGMEDVPDAVWRVGLNRGARRRQDREIGLTGAGGCGLILQPE